VPKPRSRPLPRKTSITAPRNHRASNRAAAKQSNASALSVADKRQAALEMRIEGHAIEDIATALRVSPGRVSQMIGEILCQKTEETRRLGDTLRAMELERIDRMMLHWYPRAKKDCKAAAVLLHWTERRHKLLGLEISKHELFGPGGGPVCVTASSLDLSKLSEEQLHQLEEIVRTAGPRLPTDQSNTLRRPALLSAVPDA
jgi:hypothetical protein